VDEHRIHQGCMQSGRTSHAGVLAGSVNDIICEN